MTTSILREPVETITMEQEFNAEHQRWVIKIESYDTNAPYIDIELFNWWTCKKSIMFGVKRND